MIWRYILNDPLFGITDISRMSLAVIVMGALAYGGRRGGFSMSISWRRSAARVTRYTDSPCAS